MVSPSHIGFGVLCFFLLRHNCLILVIIIIVVIIGADFLVFLKILGKLLRLNLGLNHDRLTSWWSHLRVRNVGR